MNPTPETETSEPQSPEAAEEREPEVVGKGTVAAGEPGEQVLGDDLDDDDDDDDDLTAETVGRTSSGLGTQVAAIIAGALGIVALTGTWTGRVVAERETLVGQLNTAQTASPAKQIAELYGDAWHATALIDGIVGLVAVIIAVIVLALPQRVNVLALPQRVNWVRPVAIAALILGSIGVVISIGMYFDLFVSLPTAPPTPAAPPAPPAG